MANPTPSRLYDICAALLAAVVDGYADQSLDLPARRYVSDGPLVAWDDEQVTVYCERTFAGLSDVEQPDALDTIATTRSARLWIEVVHCSPHLDSDSVTLGPVPTPPTAAAIDASAQVALVDAIMLPWSVRRAKRAGDLDVCHGITIDDWQPLGPLGGMIGSRLGLRYQLDSV